MRGRLNVVSGRVRVVGEKKVIVNSPILDLIFDSDRSEESIGFTMMCVFFFFQFFFYLSVNSFSTRSLVSIEKRQKRGFFFVEFRNRTVQAGRFSIYFLCSYLNDGAIFEYSCLIRFLWIRFFRLR